MAPEGREDWDVTVPVWGSLQVQFSHVQWALASAILVSRGCPVLEELKDVLGRRGSGIVGAAVLILALPFCVMPVFC